MGLVLGLNVEQIEQKNIANSYLTEPLGSHHGIVLPLFCVFCVLQT